MRHAYLPAKDLGMDIIVGCIGAVLIAYLFFSVVRPERF
jgi:hypothetical protein